MLERIVAAKREEVARKGEAVLEDFYSRDCLPMVRDFTGIFTPGNRVSLIAEAKKASPLKGVLLTNHELADLARLYQDNGARGVSVITEERFFKGNPELIEVFKQQIDLPVLRKDFIIDERQIYETRLLGADAVLLIARLLSSSLLLRLVELAQQLELEPLVEVHDHEDLKRTLDTPTRVIGINNRNLNDFTVDTRVSLELKAMVPDGVACIAESGISTPADMATLERHGFRGALVGEALVTAEDIGAKVRELAGYLAEYEGGNW